MNTNTSPPLPVNTEELETILVATGPTINERIRPPKGFKRILAKTNSFEAYLRHLPLKSDTAQVRYYNGSVKPNYGNYVAVIDLPIGKKNLHQCADAVMHLRAMYLYIQQRYNDIHFNFTNGFRVDYAKWRAGSRIKINGNDTYWLLTTDFDDTYKAFWNYLEMIFTYAGTYSLEKELIPVTIEDLQIGDVFIQGGFPGHAVIVVDVVKADATGKKLFLLAQSFMPAQELQVLSNPNNSDLSPWYDENFGAILKTPDWEFSRTDLKRFSQ